MVDTELFIMVVRKYPCLWDMSSDGYSNHREKQQYWELIAEELELDYDNKNEIEKKELIDNLKKKWKNIRDSFKKEFNIQTGKGKPAPTAHRQYKYFNQLSFLIPTTISEPRESNLTDFEGESCSDKDYSNFGKFEAVYTEELHTNLRKSLKSKPKRIKNVDAKVQYKNNIEIKEKLYETLEENIRLKQNEIDSADEDKMFLLSLLKDFKRIPEDQKLRFKAEFLNDFSKCVERYTQSVHQANSSVSNTTS